MNAVKRNIIPDSFIDEFERKGAVCLRGLFAQSR